MKKVKDKRKLIIYIILIIAIIIILLGIIYKTFFTKKDLDINSSTVQELYKMANPSDDASLLKFLYSSDELPDNYKIAMGIMAYIKDHGEDESISSNDVSTYVKKTLGDTSYKDHDTYIFTGDICGYFYDETTSSYSFITGCGGNEYESFYRKIVSAKKDGDTITIDEKSIYVYNNFDETSNKVFVYNDYNQDDLLNYFETSDDYTINIDDYLDSATTYEYTFVKSGNSYVFKSIKSI